MDDAIPKLPRYVFRRANGSYRYKRNVPKALRQVIPKATIYRQLGNSYDEAIRRLPVVHAEVEALFDEERSTPNSVRAKSIVRERLGEWHAGVFADGVVDPEWDVTDDFRELAMELEGSTPPEVVRQVGSARLSPEPMTLHKVLSDYYTYKCDDRVGDKALKARRKSEGLSQEEFAHRLGLSVSYISLLETENRQPTLTVLAAVAGEFGISLAEFAAEIEIQ